MATRGITTYDATQYHIWTWVYKKDNTYAMYMDGVRCRAARTTTGRSATRPTDEPIDMDFLFDAGWGHNQIGSVDKELPASAFDGKYYEFNYSRVYLSGNGDVARNGPHILPGTVPAADYNAGGPDVAYSRTGKNGPWYKYTVQVPSGGHYQFRFRVAATTPGGTFHLEDEKGVSLTGPVAVPRTTGATGALVTASAPATLSTGGHVLRWVVDRGHPILKSLIVARAAGTRATFVKADRATQGSWKGVYGADGYMIAGDSTSQPKYGSVSKTGWTVTWNGSTTDARAPQKAGGTDRVAGQWGANDRSYDIDCSLTDGATHQVSLYGLDWDMNGRDEEIQVLDAASGALLDSRTEHLCQRHIPRLERPGTRDLPRHQQ